MKDRYVLDSNIWIEIHRNNSHILGRVGLLLEGNEVCLVDVIVAEVLRGVRTSRDYTRLERAFGDFPIISTTWEKVGWLGFKVARRGYSPPLVDLYIAQAVQEEGRTLITQDRHFAQIAEVNGLSFERV